MTRDETRFSPNVGSLYSFVETSGWTVTPTQCTFHVNGGITSGYYWNFTGYSQLQWYENGTWHNFASEKSGTYSGYGDKVYDSRNDAFDRHSTNRTVRVGNYAHAYVNGQSTSATAYIEYIVPALPPDATSLDAVRNSDTSVTLSWATSMGYAESVRVERSIDGSSFSEIASLSNLASSYTDNSTAADHTYTYRWRYYNQNAYGGYSSTSSVTMAPSAPTKITVARATSTNVNVTLTNPSSVAMSIQWQVTYDGGSTWSASTSVSGSPVTSFVASTNGGTVKIRVRNVNDTGSSAWIVSDSVVTLVPPAPPTLINPKGIVDIAYSMLVFEWKHNPLDGSAQTAAILQYTVGNTSAQVPIGTENTYTLDIHNVAAGSSYSWKVRTKGADPSYSDWSSTISGKLYAKPQIYFIAQNPPSTVTALPIPIEVGYSDPQFKPCASAVMTVKRDGRTVYSEPLTIGSDRLTGQITAAELLPEQGATYTVSVTARSGSTLESTTNTTFNVDYIEPTHGTVQVQNEPDTGYASLLATFDNHASDRSYTGNTNSTITVDGAAIRSMTVDGKSVQDGTPSPSAPVPIQVVSGANLCPRGFPASTTSNNVTFVRQSDGSIKITTNGTASGNAQINSGNFKLQAGTYTIGGVNTDDVRMQLYVWDIDNGRSIGKRGNNYTNYTFTTTTALNVTFVVYIYSGAAVNETVYPRLSVGTVDFPYVPYGSLGLKVSGLNKAQTPFTYFGQHSGRGVTYSQSDGVVSASGTATGLAYLLISSNSHNDLGLAAGSTYTISTTSQTGNIYLLSISGGSTNKTDSYTFTIPTSGNWHVGVYVKQGTTVSESFKIMLNEGSTATDYTPYVDSLTPIPLAGHVLASLPDGTKDVLSVGASGHCVIAKRTNRIASYNGESVGSVYIATTGTLETGAEVYYKRSSATTVDLGYITMPELADSCTVEVLASLSTPLQMVSYDGLADAESISVIRVNKDGSRTQLADHAANYTAIVDKYAPLNTAYVYEVVTYAASGAYAVEVTPNLLESTRWFAYWGENNIAWAQWNPSGSYTLARPEKKRVHYAGRKWPVSYDSKAMDQSHSMTWTVVDMDDWRNGFVDLMNDGGRGVYKGCDGWVFHADFDYSATPQYTSITKMGDMSLTISRIDGAQL